MRLRRRSTLSYEIPPPTHPLAVMADALARMQGRPSLGYWRRACEASLRASRRRRGLRA